MPWEKQFNPDDALDKAMLAFWAGGYEATSMQDLVDCMGINRGSMYATFGDKRSLFIKALHRYKTTRGEPWIQSQAENSESARGAITGAFETVIDTVVDAGSRNGCFLINTALELSPHDEEVAGVVAKGIADMEVFFRRMIERGQEAGEISASVDPVEAARALLSLFIGLRVLSRSRPEEVLLRSVARQAEVLLG